MGAAVAAAFGDSSGELVVARLDADPELLDCDVLGASTVAEVVVPAGVELLRYLNVALADPGADAGRLLLCP